MSASILSRRTVAASVAAIGLSFASIAAQAALLDGTLGFNNNGYTGSVVTSGVGIDFAATPNSQFTNPTGSVATEIGTPLPVAGNFNDVLFASPGLLFTVGNLSFSWATYDTITDVAGIAVYIFHGTLTAAGYDPTPYTVRWSTTDSGANYSGSGANVPLPGTAALLGLGFLGLGVSRRRAAA
jgi:hypothetical protein